MRNCSPRGSLGSIGGQFARSIASGQTPGERLGQWSRSFGDVTRLTELGIDYSLLLDLGCFHSIPDASRDAYVRGVTALARAGATL